MNGALTFLEEAAKEGARVPSKRTLDRYGLSAQEWVEILQSQGWRCPICEGSKKTWNTDHEHVPGWVKLDPEERKIYVRGILCWRCNRRHAPSNMSASDARRLADYLEAYEIHKSYLTRDK